MRSLLYKLLGLALLSACGSAYQGLEPAAADPACVERIRPKTPADTRYQCSIDVIGKHLSGLLLVKNMPDSSYRLVFTNEAGFKFLDFAFDRQGGFTVHYILEQMDRKAVIRTLRQDFALLLGLPFGGAPQESFSMNAERYLAFPFEGERAYLVSDGDCRSLRRVEWASRRKKKLSLEYPAEPGQGPILIRHHTFNMSIELSPLKTD